MRFNRVVNPSTGWRDSLFQEHRVGPPGGCVEGSVFFRVCVAAAASRLSVGAETEMLEDDEDGEDDDDDQRDAESLRDVFFWEAGEGLVLLSHRGRHVWIQARCLPSLLDPSLSDRRLSGVQA